MRKIPAFCLILFCCCFFEASAQGLKPIIAAIDSFHKRQPIEKLYLQTDKPYYAIGDTMRFKAYLLDESLSASLKSGIMYVELINDSSRVCKRQTIMLSKGMTWGDIVIKKTWYPGNYTMRAYTNWMRNFGEEHFFTKPVSIIPSGNQRWLVNEQVIIDKDKNVSVLLHLSDFDHKSIGFQDITLNILNGTSVVLKNAAKTDGEGNTAIKFRLPENSGKKPLSVLIEDKSKEGNKSRIEIPIQFNRPENIDLQFMPEGGNLIAGIKTRIGFKAIGEDGKGKDISGKVYDSKQQEVAVFKSTHLGMGSFELDPQPGESYTAKIDSNTKNYALAAINPSGIALRVNAKGEDSLEIVLSRKSEVKSPKSATQNSGLSTYDSNNYYLIGQARDKVCYGAKIEFKDSKVNRSITKNIFPTGIIKFVLLDSHNQPVNQRMVFVDHNDLLNIHVNDNKVSYLPRDSIGLQLAVTDKDNNPVQGHFSLAVTDDGQVKTPNADAENIASFMLLDADLKGMVEEAGYYFNKEHPDREAALDNLLLTQGWAGYDWKPVFAPPLKPEYEAETQFIVKGRASNLFNSSINKTDIMLISTKPVILLNTKTDKDGRFTFSNFPFLDTINFRVQTKRTFNIGIMVDEFIPSEFTPAKIQGTPWYLDSDSTLVNYINRRQAEQEEAFNAGKSKLLKTVVINEQPVDPTTRKIMQLDEEEIRNARPGKKPMRLWQLLDRDGKISQMYIKLSIDGQSLNTDSMENPVPFYHPWAQHIINEWIGEFNTEDIKAFKVTRRIMIVKKHDDLVYLDVQITTNVHMWRGSPPNGAYAYRPMPISWPHRFYSPRYSIKDTAAVKDRRSTIFWAPDIATDANGKADVSFYSADALGTYSLRLEGSDMNGNVGYNEQKIKITSKTSAAK